MKKLKRHNLFYGKTNAVTVTTIINATIIMLSCLIISDYVENKNKYIFWAVGSAVLLFLGFFVNYFIARRLTDKEKEKIKNSSPPEWKQVPKTMKEHFVYNKNSIVMGIIIVAIFELVLAVCMLIKFGLTSMLFMLAIFVPLTIIAFIIISVTEYMWANMDDSAVYTTLRVDHNFSVEEKTKNRTVTKTYIVLYLPDGKYVLDCKEKEKIPEEIIVIKYKNLIRWENAEKFI